MTEARALIELRRASSWRTICEVQREIYDLATELPEPVRTKLRQLVIEAFIMGKKMDAKLREYNQTWDTGFYLPNPDRRADRHRRQG